MDAYIYNAALWCGACVIDSLVRSGKASPAARDMAPADALDQIVESNGFTCEADYDSDDLPKGPYAHGGGEADCPQHCDACRVFLGNDLTPDGSAYVKQAFKAYHEDARGALDVLQTWAFAYPEEYGEACREVSPGFPDNLDDDWVEILPAV